MRDLSQYTITLFDANPDVIQAWHNHFAQVPKVIIKQCSLQELNPQDVSVIPTNSFGILDTGIAQEATQLMSNIDQRVHKQLAIEREGQQPVGTCTLLRTEIDRFRYLALTPTTRTNRTPTLPPTIYDAFRAIFLAVTNAQGSSIHHVAVPGLGTGPGQPSSVSPDQSAAYMRMAYDSFRWDAPRNWEEINRWINNRL